MSTCHILVTGGAGYLGSVLVPELLSSGFGVTVVDSFMYEQNSLLACCAHDTFDVVRGDVRDEGLMKPLLKRADYVIPLAALVGAPLCDRRKADAVSINRDAVEMIVRNLSRDQRVIIPTTNSGYGIGRKDAFCTEESPLTPLSLYGKTKVEAEKTVIGRGNAISLRLATVFGVSPRMRVDLLVNDFTWRAVKDRFVVLFEGHFRRNYIHIRDVARAFLHSLNGFEALKDQVYNVGLSDANLTKVQLCEEIKKEVPEFVYLESPVGEDIDKRDYLVSNEKIERTGYRPVHSLADGIRELAKAYRALDNHHYGNV